ncbi:movement protein [Entoleuca phenui-like virus 1]|uniref:Movement protein n=1 Tax=Entoleuca phenui-like virus 1 TaxID=2086640 RepID=A0A4D6Q3I0_9VIRU|nr:movement protein [Entoleuca phenui-like virus 1]QCF40769.1 movement protein [Entoleuca phenui-like virus 1]
MLESVKMLRKFFGRRGSDNKPSGARPGGSIRGSITGSRKMKDKETEDREARRGAVLRNMDEALFASGVPKNHVSMADKLDSHKAGSTFKYAVIGTQPSEERTGIMNKLRNYKAPSKLQNFSLSDIPFIRLMDDEVEFSMKEALRSSNAQKHEDYCLIDSVLIHFVPLDSFLNDKSPITIQLNDFRRVNNTVARLATVDNTMSYNILFCLDYCVESRDLERMTLSFACPQKDFQPGVAWGAVKVIAQVKFMSFPVRMPVIETMAVAIFADTDLLEYEWDPREFDAVLGPQALQGVRQANKRGELENLTIAKNDRMEVGMARTLAMGSLEEEEPGEAIQALKNAALLRQRQANSTGKGKGILKHDSFDSPTEEKELDPDDSASQVLSGLSEEIPGPRNVTGSRTVNFT